MSKNQSIVYFTEGETEQKFIKVMKTELQCIAPGKIYVLNVLTHLISRARLNMIPYKSIVVLVFDTDVPHMRTDILDENISFLRRYCAQVITVPQVRNLEEELVYSTDISNIEELLSSTSVKNFKNDFQRHKESAIRDALKNHHFRIEDLWIRTPEKPYDRYYMGISQLKINSR